MLFVRKYKKSLLCKYKSQPFKTSDHPISLYDGHLSTTGLRFFTVYDRAMSRDFTYVDGIIQRNFNPDISSAPVQLLLLE